jgi:DNA-binding Xre family transcriptional regulator
MSNQINLSPIISRLKEVQGDQSLRMVANDIGISAATLCRFQNGKCPNLSTLIKICKYLQIDINL